jgi:hypothetical protein
MRAQTEEEEQSLTNMYASKVMMFVAQVAMGLLVPFAILYFASKIIFDPKARALPKRRPNILATWKAATVLTGARDGGGRILQRKHQMQVYGVKHNAGLWAFMADPVGMVQQRSPDYHQPIIPASASDMLRNGFSWVTRKVQNSGLAQLTPQLPYDAERKLDLPQTHAGLQPVDSRIHPSESRMKEAGPTWGDRAVRAIKGTVFVSNHMVPDTSGPGRTHADIMYREIQNKNAVPAMGASAVPYRMRDAWDGTADGSRIGSSPCRWSP